MSEVKDIVNRIKNLLASVEAEMRECKELLKSAAIDR